MKRKRNNKSKKQTGKGFDIQKTLNKTGVEFHWPGYRYLGPGTHLKLDAG